MTNKDKSSEPFDVYDEIEKCSQRLKSISEYLKEERRREKAELFKKMVYELACLSNKA